MGVLIVGAGLGGIRTAQALRRHGYRDEVTLVGAEPHPPYDRPPLTKSVLRGESDDTTFDIDWAALDLDARFALRATRLDVAHAAVHLDDGGSLPYDTLVLATGATPRVLPGLSAGEGVHVLRTIDDARRLRASLLNSRRVVVIGGGFVGCEVAASARLLGAEVDLVESLSAPLGRALGADAADVATELLRQRGVRVHASTAVTNIIRSAGVVTGVALANGTVLSTYDVVVALGVTPDVGWLAGSGVDLDDGICCDAMGRTSVAEAYALGDAAAWQYPLAGGRRRIEHWTTTVEQAELVAARIAGADPSDSTAALAPLDVPYFWSDIFETKIQALGFLAADCDTRVLWPRGKAVVLYSRDGRLTGVVGFSAARHVMRLRASIVAGAAVDDVVASFPL